MQHKLLHFDAISIIMIILIASVTLVVGSFAARYMQGDRKRSQFYILLSMLLASITTLVCADNIFVFLVTWAASNFLLVALMQHKSDWLAAKNSARLAGKNFILGLFCLVMGFAVLYYATRQTSIQSIIHSDIDKYLLLAAQMFFLLAAMTQSALWPFHRWLLSSLNSPTPVSALMHAGLVNGGGFLLARFAPLYFNHPNVLAFIVVIGMCTVVLGNVWKLMQSDVKRMLACSTMGQMGFMVVQCGLGLFAAAIAHLCLHGLFKAYLFLASGSAGKETSSDSIHPATPADFILAAMLGLISAFTFALLSNKIQNPFNTNLLLILVAYIAGAQLALSVLASKLRIRVMLALITCAAMGAIYGTSVYIFQTNLNYINTPQQIHLIHVLSMLALFALWVAAIFYQPLLQTELAKKIMSKIYVYMLNASQPHPTTITAHRYQYQY